MLLNKYGLVSVCSRSGNAWGARAGRCRRNENSGSLRVKRWDGEEGNKNTAQTLKGDRIRVLLITCVCAYLYIRWPTPRAEHTQLYRISHA